MDYAILSAELANDPLTRGYAAMTDNEVWVSMTTADRPARALVPIWKIKKHAIESGYWLALKNCAVEHPGYVAAALAVDYISDSRFENIDLDLTITITMLGGLVATSLITQTQADEIDALADTLQSRADELGLVGLSNGYIKEAR